MEWSNFGMSVRPEWSMNTTMKVCACMLRVCACICKRVYRCDFACMHASMYVFMFYAHTRTYISNAYVNVCMCMPVSTHLY
jgi:hypothetical protein